MRSCCAQCAALGTELGCGCAQRLTLFADEGENIDAIEEDSPVVRGAEACDASQSRL